MKYRCKECKKKINQMMKDIYTCRCKNIYCAKHLHVHNFTFDYKSTFCKEISKNMPVVTAKN